MEGLLESGDEVQELNVPLELDTAGRVAAVRQPWRLMIIGYRLVRCWIVLAWVARRRHRAADIDAILVGYLGHVDIRLARWLYPNTVIALDHLVSLAGVLVDRGLGDRDSVGVRLVAAVDKGALERADAVVLDTVEQTSLLPSFASGKAVVAPVGAGQAWFSARTYDTSAASLRPLRVIFFGLFTPLHGATTISQALASLATDKRIVATMVGTGQDYPAARRQAAANKQVTWVDWVPNDELPALVARHDVCLGIFGTTAQALRVVPTKVFQGAAAGCAIVTSDTSPQRRILGDAAVFVRPGDAEGLAQVLRDLAVDAGRLSELRRLAAGRADEAFTPVRIAEPVRRRVQALLTERAQPLAASYVRIASPRTRPDNRESTLDGPQSPLFITRKFPPSVGGMQTLAATMWQSLSDDATSATIISHTGTNLTVPLWLLAAYPRAAAALRRPGADAVVTGDALTCALFEPLIRSASVPYATVVHGLDVTYRNPIYRAVVHRALRSAPRVIAVSQATARAAQEVGVERARISVIRPGIDVPPVTLAERAQAGRVLREWLSIDAEDVILLTLGRLVRRKGVAWFLQYVLPQLPRQTAYVVAGHGPESRRLSHIATHLGLHSRVRFLGEVSDTEREALLRGADLFIQPNIQTAGDMEGFGLVVVEATMRGTPTVASALEGILDAVVDGETGILLPPGEREAWVDCLRRLIADDDARHDLGARFARNSRGLFTEEQMRRGLRAALLGGALPGV